MFQLLILACHLYYTGLTAPTNNPIPLSSNYSTFLSLVSNSNFPLNLTNVTVYAPTNAAFQNINPTTLLALQQPALAPLTRRLLDYHVVQGINYTFRNSSNATNPTSYNTTVHQSLLFGLPVIHWTNGTEEFINDARIVDPDMQFGGVLVQGIDKVLNPEFALIFLNGLQTNQTLPLWMV